MSVTPFRRWAVLPASRIRDFSISSVGTYIASGSFARKVAILDERGEELFGVFLPEELSAQPVFSECATFLFCPCSNGAMYCLDSRLKKISWGFPTSDKVSAACVWDTLLAFGSYNGSCYCVSFEVGPSCSC